MGIKLKSEYLGAFYLQHSKFKKEYIVNLLEYFKQLIQSNFNEIVLSNKLKKSSSDLRNKKLEFESFLDIL